MDGGKGIGKRRGGRGLDTLVKVSLLVYVAREFCILLKTALESSPHKTVSGWDN